MQVVRNITTFIILVAGFLTTGCVMDGVKHVTVLDDNSEPLKGVIVIPLYASSAGIGFGAEGVGSRSETQFQVKKPFLFNSGEDLMVKQLHQRCVVIPLPLPPWCMGIRSGDGAFAWLFVKKQKGIIALSENDLCDNKTIFMTNTAPSEVYQTVDLLLNPRGDYEAIKKRFGLGRMQEIQNVQVILDDADRELLKAQRY